MRTIVLALWALLALLTRAIGANNVCLGNDGGYAIAKTGETTSILTSRDDAAVIHHAAASLATDMMRMVPNAQVVVRNVSAASAMQTTSERVLFVGSSTSALIQGLATSHGSVASQASLLDGKWESWSSVLLPDRGVVLMGSDRRGTAYALYTLSEEVGVSPWKWFADVQPTTTHNAVYYSPSRSEGSFGSNACSHGPPMVKYRGIFLNDEAPALTNWARTHFGGPFPPASSQSFNDAMYTHVFELLLRLRANLLWPAMWADSFAVAGLDDLPNNGTHGKGAAGPNQLLADRMGIVFGTSHQEPMARNTPEWNTWYQGPWDYTKNRENITTYWQYGVDRAEGLETMFTMSMRGNGDKALDGANIELLETIMAKQKSLLPHTANGVSVPMMMCLYTEVQGYYNEGLRVDDDITLLWTDDNFGFIRRIPTADEKNRSAGAGLYYHADYVGPPRSYKWLNTVNLVNAWEQLNVAFANDQREMFVLNVGDLKPVEVPIHFMLDMAYDSSRLSHASNVSTWLDTWAAKTFGAGPNDEHLKIAEVVRGYSWLNSRIKPELVNATTWSVVNHAEAESVLAEWDRLETMVSELEPYFRDGDNWDAFFQLVAYPTLASANLNRMHVAVGRNNLAGTQAKNSANHWAARAREHLARDAELTSAYHSLGNGKWKHMMSQPHMGSQYWQQPMRNMLPPLAYMHLDDTWADTALGSNLRVGVDGSMGAWPGDNQYNCPDGYNCPDPTLPALTRYSGDQRRSIWVSAGDAQKFAFSATTNASWLGVAHRLATDSANATQGARYMHRRSDGFEAGAEFDDEVEVQLSVDWTALPKPSCTGAAQMHTAMVYINATNNERLPGMSAPTNVTVSLSVDSCMPHDEAAAGTFVASPDGSVSMLASHATIESARDTSFTPAYIESLPGYGLLGSAVTVLPPTAESIDRNDTANLGRGPSLAFDFYLPHSSGNETAFNVTAWLAPVLNYRDKRPLRYALELDSDAGSRVQVTPVPENITPGTNSADWGNVVSANIRTVTSTLSSSTATQGGKHTLRWWPLEPGLVLQKIVIEPHGKLSARTTLGLPESRRVGML
uniref:D-glucuronidase n=1 Tax=Ustilago sp. SL-2014 TaxID=1593447 RepID=A0A0B5A1C0_9BASI|nr:D-glucuronidase [Ustilago sp. SL-2014]